MERERLAGFEGELSFAIDDVDCVLALAASFTAERETTLWGVLHLATLVRIDA